MEPNDSRSWLPQVKGSTERLGPDVDTTSSPARIDSATIASLAERFYDLFPEATPRGPSDLAYFAILVEDFDALLDIVEQMKRFAAWTLDHGTGIAKSPRNGLRDWLQRTCTGRPYRY